MSDLKEKTLDYYLERLKELDKQHNEFIDTDKFGRSTIWNDEDYVIFCTKAQLERNEINKMISDLTKEQGIET